MPCAKFCNSRLSSAAVVASIDSVLYCCTDSVQAILLYVCLIQRLIEWTWPKLCYKTRATATIKAAKLCHIDVHAGHLCRFLQSKSVKSVAGGAIPTVWYFTNSTLQVITVSEGAPVRCLMYTLCTEQLYNVQCSLCKTALEHSANAQHSVLFSEK